MNCIRQNLRKWPHQIVILLLLPLILGACSNPVEEEKESFNEDWKFHQGDASLAMNADFDDSGWRMLDLPHDWSIEGSFSDTNSTGPAGGGLPAGVAWYRKSFTLKKSKNLGKVYVDFDGIYRNSEVWINGHYLGKRASGYASFSYELTPWLKEAGKENIIAVKVDNSLQPNSRWYTGSGIYRNTWLRRVPEIHIEKYGIFISTPAVSHDTAEMKAEISFNNFDSLQYPEMEILSYIYSPSNSIISRFTRTPVNGRKVEIHHNILEPELWSTTNPAVYTLRTEVFVSGKRLERRDTEFGIRSFHFKVDSGFYLNDQHLEIKGINLHHDLGALGAAVNKRAMERQLEIMQGMGVNAIRCAHNIPAPELLELCDHMGLLVMDESFDVWAKKKVKYDYHMDWEENHVQDLENMVLRDRNHPSIFMWSIGNEIREQFDSSGLSITCKLVDIVRELDPTRPVTCAMTETNPERNYIYQSGCLDILGFNYKHYDWKDFQEKYPGEVMIATENMSAYATRGHYDMPSDSIQKWPEKYKDPLINPNPDYTVSAYDMISAFWGATHEETLREYYRHDFLPGLFIWSGIDYLGEPDPYLWPAKNSYFGVVDLAGLPKDAYYLYKSIWTEDTVLHVFPHWNWEVGQVVDVWAYYNHADEVELLLNGESLGSKRKGPEDFHVSWRLKYQPGTLKAISRKGGEIIREQEIHTSGEAARVMLVPDRAKISTEDRDLCFVTVTILDAEGNLVPYAENEVHFELEGPGIIAGVDNGYQASQEPHQASQRKAWKGKCLVIIQSTGKKGNIMLKASSEGLQGDELEIEVGR